MISKNIIIFFITTIIIFLLGWLSGIIFNEIYSSIRNKNTERNQFLESQISELDLNMPKIKRIIRQKNICRLKNDSKVMCYFNTLMQCMAATKNISDFFLENVEKNAVIETIKELFLKMKRNKEFDTTKILLKIHNYLGEKKFSDLKQQQDIQALYSALVSACLPENLIIIKNPIAYKNAAKAFRVIPVFYFLTETKTFYELKDRTETVFEINNCFILPGTRNIERKFSEYFLPEIVRNSEENENLDDIEIVSKITKYSEVLVIYSLWYSNKTNERMKIYKELIINEYYKYELISFGCHNDTLESCLYISVIKLDENIWAILSHEDIKYFNWRNIHNYLDYHEYKPIIFFFQIIS